MSIWDKLLDGAHEITGNDLLIYLINIGIVLFILCAAARFHEDVVIGGLEQMIDTDDDSDSSCVLVAAISLLLQLVFGIGILVAKPRILESYSKTAILCLSITSSVLVTADYLNNTCQDETPALTGLSH